MVSINTVCFQGICRDYRNAVVQHIRTSLKSNYPDDWLSKLISPFQKEWDAIRDAGNKPRRTGEIGGQLVDEFDLLGVNHFYNLFDKYFRELFPDVHDMPEESVRKTKQAILRWAGTIKDLRDPALGHPAEADMDVQDAFMMLDSARRILQFINPDVAEQLATLYDDVSNWKLQLTVEPIPEQRVVEGSTLPSRESIAPRFVGRQTELANLTTWYKDPHSQVWLLAGDGGKGKTAIAYQFAVSIRNDPPPELEIVIWLSAKARRFVSGQSLDIESPDFWDLDSALACVLQAYGAIDVAGKDIQTKAEECLEYLRQLPALIILDDVDSLEGRNLEAMNFFIERTHTTPSKVLLTSRRVPFGMEPRTTQVTGFESASEDGIAFIDSRIKLYELEPGQFSRALKTRILETCDGSPLFVEDLLRLFMVGETPGHAIQLWKAHQGENARRYALQREFDMLSDLAKKALLSCALFPEPVSLPEIEVTAGIPKGQCYSAIQELHNLFLLPRPSFTEDVPRFALNSNTRQLVREVYGGTDLAQRISSSIKVIMGEVEATPAQQRRIGQYIRQAVTQVKLDQHSSAEETLLVALKTYAENSDLHGTLGWVYKTWSPNPRFTDARKQFIHAADLKSKKEDTYRHWWQMERGQLEWTSAASAAERGLEMISSSERLAYMAGFARSQSAKDLYQQAQYSRAEQEAKKAEVHLKNALLDIDDVGQGQYQFHSSIYRAMVINYEYLVRISQNQQDSGGERYFLRLLDSSLRRWANEHPGDPNASSEKQRLVYRFPSLNK